MSELRSAFLQYLRDSDVNPGDKIPGEVELAARFGVSRAAMREVLTHLQSLGLLERTKSRGTFLQAVDPDDLQETLAACFQLSGFGGEELKEARLVLESAVLPLAVRRLSPTMLQRMEALLDTMEAAAGEPETADQLDRDFHLLLIEACQSPVLRLFSSVIYLLFRRQHRTRFWTEPAIRNSVAGHRAILDAMRAGDVDTARERLQAHIAPG